METITEHFKIRINFMIIFCLIYNCHSVLVDIVTLTPYIPIYTAGVLSTANVSHFEVSESTRNKEQT